VVYLQALRGWRCPKEPQINPKKQIQTHISDNFKTDSYSTAIRFVLKIRAFRFFWQTALNFLSDGSDNLIDRIRCNVRCCVASVCWVSLASNLRTYPMFVPLGKQCIPLGREVCCWRILPRVYVLITCLLCISDKGEANPSVACYSNISSDPWHDVMDDG